MTAVFARSDLDLNREAAKTHAHPTNSNSVRHRSSSLVATHRTTTRSVRRRSSLCLLWSSDVGLCWRLATSHHGDQRNAQTRTADFACEACGAKVTLHPSSQIFAERLLGSLLIPARLPSVFLFLSAHRRARAWTDNRIVGGAIAAHATPGPRDRVCACGAAAACTAIIRSSSALISTGTHCEYKCRSCSKTFASLRCATRSNLDISATRPRG